MADDGGERFPWTAIGDTGMDEAGRATCLIVDDEAPLRQVLGQLMRSLGFTCAEAASGEQALPLLADGGIALLISDVRMPGMDGIELLSEIRRRSPDTAVVMITAVADLEVAVKCLGMGAMDYLTKPFHVEEVRARVRQALERRRLVMENRDYQERLEERVHAQSRRLEELFLTGIQSLAEALEVKDPYTRGHSIRVARYSGIIGRALNLDDDMIYQIELGGNVHDLGKIGVREAVLNKRGRLTPAEYEHIMIHPVVGWRILAPLLGDAPAALNIVRSHHERMDGRGVPDGLRGRAIPMEARIAAVADAIDAMTSGRPYRSAELTLDGAVQELQKHVGDQFDPEVVDAAARAVDSGLLELAPRTPFKG
ncbi:MAG TPA: HD domain-containing phosphohydrolase [Gemmatimonadaceae bacterium]|nr:HD domain-containing phosphohydrolase [Gemmatimonadaceae bacterium]